MNRKIWQIVKTPAVQAYELKKLTPGLAQFKHLPNPLNLFRTFHSPVNV